MKVYIDGENLVHRLCDAYSTKRTNLLEFDIRELMKRIVPKAHDADINYYATKIKIKTENKKHRKIIEEMVAWNARWVNKLNQQNITYIKAGNMKLRDSTKCPHCKKTIAVFQEKGVDVRMAVDIVLDAKEAEEIVIVSSDSDLLPAIRAARKNGARVTYIAYADAINAGIALNCDQTRTYDKDMLKTLRKNHG